MDPVMCLTSSCVTIPDRLNVEKMSGVYLSHMVGKRDYENFGTKEVPCNKNDKHIGARQIFKVFNHTNLRTPTIKHHCPRTDVAASLRACSNKVTPDGEIFQEYSNWFRKEFIPTFYNFLDNEDLNVNLDKWLHDQGYTENYCKKIRTAFEVENWSHGKENMRYKAFPKIEMQFTTVLNEFKDTELNNVKERQICGPSDEKKAMANAFINLMEKIAHKFLKEYCGRCDWMQMCKKVEKALGDIKNIIFCAADGSGFDMSQLIQFNKLMNELLITCAKHKNVTFDTPLSIEHLIRALENSLILNVDVNNGDLKYTAQGRASGDGWTTFCNTMLMISYYLFTFYKANIPECERFLLVKGDDVLLAMNNKYRDVFEETHSLLFTSSKEKHSHGLGQICTEIKWGSILEMDFLSNHFFFTNKDRLRMTRIPARVFQTISWSTKLKPYSEKLQKELCFSKGMSLLAWSQGLPIFEKLGRKMVELGVKGQNKDYNKYVEEARKWHPRDDYKAYLTYLNDRYGVTAGNVRKLESQIDGIRDLNGLIFNDVLDLFY
jgi:uncharacterized short protein YbdD (DUF466 family)